MDICKTMRNLHKRSIFVFSARSVVAPTFRPPVHFAVVLGVPDELIGKVDGIRALPTVIEDLRPASSHGLLLEHVHIEAFGFPAEHPW